MFHLHKTLFRNIEKTPTKCVNLKGAIKKKYIYTKHNKQILKYFIVL